MSAVAPWLPETVLFGGNHLRVAAWLDHAELARRGLGAAVTREVLEGLFVLPTGVPASEASLPAWALRPIMSAPSWAAELGPDGWLRTYRPPAHVNLVSVADWETPVDRQFEELEWMSPIAPRVVVTSLGDAARSVERAKARGVGLLARDGAQSGWMVLAPSNARVRITCHRWWLAECVASATRRAGARPAKPSPSAPG